MKKQPSEKAKAHIESLKRVKVPFWSRWLGNFRAWKRARKARKVWHSIGTAILIVHTSNGRKLLAYLNFFERGDGKRKFIFDRGQTMGYPVKTWSPYHEVVVPWLHRKYTNQQIADWCIKTQKAVNTP